MSFFRNALDSLLFFSPPGVCLWSPDHTSKHVAGVLATEAASSMLPYCCPSSSRNRSTLPIQSATGLNCWLHSCWKPPPHPMRSDFCRITWFRLAGRVRPSHKASTIAHKVARTCPSSRRRSGNRAACNATCASFSQRTVSIPIANHSSLRAAVKSFRRWRGPLGCKLSVHWIPQHNLNLSRDMRRKTSSSWALLVSPI